MFYWRLITDDDGDPCIDESNAFNTKEEAYDDMKNEALKKINRNTEDYEDFSEDEGLNYNIVFFSNKIICTTWYDEISTYEIYEK